MSRKKQQVLERLIGNGKVYKDDQFLSEVRYDLQIAQEYFIVKSLSGNEEVPGLKNISGHITPIKSREYLKEGTLHLEDGRKWKFFTQRGNPISGYRVINSSSEGIVSE